MAFSKSVPKGQIPVGCQLCEGGHKIEWKCTDCNLLMCDRCKDNVHLKIAKDHRIVTIKEIGNVEDSWDSFVFSDLKCQDHPDQSCSLYCKTCSKVICLKCIIKVHNGHTFVEEEELNNRKVKLKEGQNKVQKNLSKLRVKKEKIIYPEEIENSKLLQIRQSIQNQKEKVVKAVEQYADNLVLDVNQHFRILREEEEYKIDQQIKKMYMKNEALESIITSKDFSQFFRDFDKMNVSLKEDILQEGMNISSLPNFVPGEFKVLNLGTLEGGLGFRENQVKFEVTNQWTTKIKNIHDILRCPDDTLWISDNRNEVLQHVKIEKDKVKMLSSFSLKIAGIADLSGNIVVSCGETRLKLIDGKTKVITDSVFDIGESFISRGINITNDQKVVIAARTPGDPFSATGRSTGRSIVVVMDQTGKRLATYEKDSNSKRLFTVAFKVTSTTNGNICVVDSLKDDDTGRVVVIGHKGNIKGIYSGHHDVNTEDKPFKPQDIVATQSYNILVTDWKNNAIHILNGDGDFILYYSLTDIGIKNPHSLALSTPGHFYLGCTYSHLLKDFGKLYSIRFS